MSGSAAAACILVLLVLSLATVLVELPTPVTGALQLALIVAAALIGAKVKRRRSP